MKIKEIIIKFYNEGSIEINDALHLIEEYLKRINKSNPQLIQHMVNPMNPFGNQMLQIAVMDSISYFESTEVTITKLTSKEGKFIKAY